MLVSSGRLELAGPPVRHIVERFWCSGLVMGMQ